MKSKCRVMGSHLKGEGLCGKPAAKEIKLPWSSWFVCCDKHANEFQRDGNFVETRPIGIDAKAVATA